MWLSADPFEITILDAVEMWGLKLPTESFIWPDQSASVHLYKNESKLCLYNYLEAF